jgi:hypothetical protein
MFENLNPFELLKEEMENDEVAIRVNAIHRLKTVVTVMGNEAFKSQILPYIEGINQLNRTHEGRLDQKRRRRSPLCHCRRIRRNKVFNFEMTYNYH